MWKKFFILCETYLSFANKFGAKPITKNDYYLLNISVNRNQRNL